MYDIIFTDKAERQLKKLEENIQGRIFIALERAKIGPKRYFEKLVGNNLFRMRVGDYRIIADIQKEQLLILVLKVGHRKNIYKN